MSIYRKGRDLIELDDLQEAEIGEIIAFARELKQRSVSGEPLELLEGVQLFLYDPDRVMPAWDPFRVAIAQLGGQAHSIQPDRINLSWSETFLDLFAQIDRAGHGLAIASTRPGEGHAFLSDTAHLMQGPVLNMLSDRAAPFQALATLMAVEERLGGESDSATCAITWAPPGLAPKPISLPLSLAEALARRGQSVRIACPTEYSPAGVVLERLDLMAPGAVQVTDDLIGALSDADLVFSMNWTNAENAEEFARAADEMRAHSAWQMSAEHLSFAAPSALLGGGLPQSRESEIEEGLLEHPRSIHLEEAANLLHMAKAVMALTLDLVRTQVTPHESIQ